MTIIKFFIYISVYTFFKFIFFSKDDKILCIFQFQDCLIQKLPKYENDFFSFENFWLSSFFPTNWSNIKLFNIPLIPLGQTILPPIKRWRVPSTIKIISPSLYQSLSICLFHLSLFLIHNLSFSLFLHFCLSFHIFSFSICLSLFLVLSLSLSF